MSHTGCQLSVFSQVSMLGESLGFGVYCPLIIIRIIRISVIITLCEYHGGWPPFNTRGGVGGGKIKL